MGMFVPSITQVSSGSRGLPVRVWRFGQADFTKFGLIISKVNLLHIGIDF